MAIAALCAGLVCSLTARPVKAVNVGLPHYSVEFLDRGEMVETGNYPGILRISTAGKVLVTNSGIANKNIPLLWDEAAGWQRIPGLKSPENSIAWGINIAGHICGYNADAQHAFFLANGKEERVNIPGVDSIAMALNDRDEVAGRYNIVYDGSPSKAFFYSVREGRLKTLTDGSGYAINNYGNVGGNMVHSGPFGSLTSTLFVSAHRANREDTAIELTGPNGRTYQGNIRAINDKCVIGGSLGGWPFIALPGGQPTFLGTLDRYSSDGEVLAINSSNVAVGYSGVVAFVWSAATGNMVDVSTLINGVPMDSTGNVWSVSYLTSINNRGEIVGFARRDDAVNRATRWKVIKLTPQ